MYVGITTWFLFLTDTLAAPGALVGDVAAGGAGAPHASSINCRPVLPSNALPPAIRTKPRRLIMELPPRQLIRAYHAAHRTLAGSLTCVRVVYTDRHRLHN